MKNIKSFKNAIAINACLTDKDNETVEFNISNNEGQSSSILELQTHKTAHPEVHYVKKIKLNSIRLDSLFKENDLNINKTNNNMDELDSNINSDETTYINDSEHSKSENNITKV